MKCQTMKIADVLFFMVNLITIYSASVQVDIASSDLTPLENDVLLKKKLDKDCPYLSKIIRDKLTNYTVDCKTINKSTDVVDAENVLQETCFAVRNILFFICDRKYKVTPDLFNLSSVSPVCPFNFSHIKLLGFKLSDNESLLLKELTLSDHCSKVCDDLYYTKNQCVVLSQLNNYLKSQVALLQMNMSTVQIDKSKHNEHNRPTIQKVESGYISKNEEMEEQAVKSKTKDDTENKTKSETTLKKEVALGSTGKNIARPTKELKSVKVITSMPKEEIKITENDSFMTGDDEFKSPLDEQNEDPANEDGVGIMADSISDRSDMDKVDKIAASPAKGKEIYPAEGFFQAEDSHFFFYFMMVSSIIVVGYLAFHNKNKILAYALEGSSSRRSRRRPNPARYRKLETNLEEAISSNAVNSTVSNIVY